MLKGMSDLDFLKGDSIRTSTVLRNNSRVLCFLRRVQPTKFKANIIGKIEWEFSVNQTGIEGKLNVNRILIYNR